MSPQEPLSQPPTTLNGLQQHIRGWASEPHCAAYSEEKIYLNQVNAYVPRCVDWKKIDVGEPIKQRTDDECWIAASLYNLGALARLTNKHLMLSYEEVRECDYHRCQPLFGGEPFMVFQYCMRRGIYAPRHDWDGLPSLGPYVPISGYLRVYPLREDFLMRAIAQQPVVLACEVDKSFEEYTGWGEFEGTMRIERNNKYLFGPKGIFTCALIPYLDTCPTAFNHLLRNTDMHVDHILLGCFCPKDRESVKNNPYLPEEIKWQYFLY